MGACVLGAAVLLTAYRLSPRRTAGVAAGHQRRAA